MKELIVKLETAPEGSRELGELVGVEIRDTWFWREPGVAVQKMPKNELHPSGENIWHSGVHHFPFPPYTTSLDAKVSGENIVKMHKRGYDLVAWHENPDGRWFLGQAKTEILARRIAGLKGLDAK